MKKNLLFIAFILITSFTFSQNVISKCNFKSILPDSIENGENLKLLSDNDFMQINEDGSFYYQITKENLIADGTWKLTKNNLVM